MGPFKREITDDALDELPHPGSVAQGRAAHGATVGPRTEPHPATVVQTKGAPATPNARPPHPATVVQTRAAPAKARPPHPATVAQTRAAPAKPKAPPPHPATVVQTRAAPAKPKARPPHPATVVQTRAAPVKPKARPPHPATVAQPRAVGPVPAVRPPHAATVAQPWTARPSHPATAAARPGAVQRSEAPPEIHEPLSLEELRKQFDELSTVQVVSSEPARFADDLERLRGDVPGLLEQAKQLVRLAPQIIARSSKGATGVYFVGDVVVKASRTSVQEYFATALAYVIGLPTAATTILARGEGEWLRQAIMTAPQGTTKVIDNDPVLLMEKLDVHYFETETVPLTDRMARLKASDFFASLGRLYVFDAFICNRDRMPSLDGSTGNPRNLFVMSLRIGTALSAPLVVALDQEPAVPKDGKAYATMFCKAFSDPAGTAAWLVPRLAHFGALGPYVSALEEQSVARYLARGFATGLEGLVTLAKSSDGVSALYAEATGQDMDMDIAVFLSTMEDALKAL